MAEERGTFTLRELMRKRGYIIQLPEEPREREALVAIRPAEEPQAPVGADRLQSPCLRPAGKHHPAGSGGVQPPHPVWARGAAVQGGQGAVFQGGVGADPGETGHQVGVAHRPDCLQQRLGGEPAPGIRARDGGEDAARSPRLDPGGPHSVQVPVAPRF